MDFLPSSMTSPGRSGYFVIPMNVATSSVNPSLLGSACATALRHIALAPAAPPSKVLRLSFIRRREYISFPVGDHHAMSMAMIANDHEEPGLSPFAVKLVLPLPWM